MEFQKARKAVRSVLQQYAGNDVLWATSVVTAVLNDLAADSGYPVRIAPLKLSYDEGEQQSE